MNPQFFSFDQMKLNEVVNNANTANNMGNINNQTNLNSLNTALGSINPVNTVNPVNGVNPYAIPSFDIEKILKEKVADENYYYLLLSVYFYLKHNNYHSTAEILFNETNLGKVFQFPQEIGEPNNDKEKLKKKFINYFYYNTFFQQSDTCDFLSDFWNQFWEIFVTKIKQSNQSNSVMDQYLANNKCQLTCKINNFIFNNLILDNSDTLHKK